MTPTNEQDTIIRKIQKLLALGQSPNEAEAASAMAFAQALLAKHNLEYATIKDTVVAGGVAQAEEKRGKQTISRSAQYEWQQELWDAIAQANFCHWSIVRVFEGKRGDPTKTSKVPVKRHAIIGRDSNVIGVRLMGEYLEDTIERLLPFPNKERMSRSAISWKAGCAARLSQRVREQAEERKRQSDAARPAANPNAGAAVVLRDIYETERQANYDIRFGDGSWARQMARQAEWAAGEAKRNEEARLAEIAYEQALLSETPAQRKARLEKEAKERAANERYWRTQDNRQRARESRIDRDAYRSGAATANGISLSTQIDAKKSDRRIG